MAEQTTETVRVLFVCIGNCVRSQMAEAIARHTAADIIAAQSAGIHPLGFIDPTARAIVSERGISMDGQFSKGLHNHEVATPDLIINMTGMPCKHLFHGIPPEENWHIDDPFGESRESHLRIFDNIHARVIELAERLRAQTLKES